MGNYGRLNKLNSPHMLQMRWLQTNRVLDITNLPGTFDLWALDARTETAGSVQTLLFTDVSAWPAKQYFFSFRALIGYSALHLTSTYANLVNVHQFYDASAYDETRYVTALNIGGSFSTRTRRWRLTVLAKNATCATVQVV